MVRTPLPSNSKHVAWLLGDASAEVICYERANCVTDSEHTVAEKEYDRAISLIQYHTQLLWQEFGAFLLAETVLIGFLGTALTQEKAIVGKNWLIFGGATLGLLLCLPWWSTFQHNYQYYRLRMAQAKRLEKGLAGTLLTEGEDLSSNKEVHIDSTGHRASILEAWHEHCG